MRQHVLALPFALASTLERASVLVIAAAMTLGCSAPSSSRAKVGGSSQPLRARAAHTATVLADGSVLIAGGCAVDGCDTSQREPSTELYTLGRGFVAGPPMIHPRAGHTATRLADGRVLIVGGFPREGTSPLAEAEIFDPATQTFRPAGTLRVGRGGHSATLLPDGRVLIAGGGNGPRALARSVELFDPVTSTFSPGPDLPHPLQGGTAIALPDGDILIAGGEDGPQHGLRSTVIYDADTGAWRTGPEMTTPRFKHAATPLADDTFLVLGGTTDDTELLASTEIYDPITNRFSPGPAMNAERYKFSDAVARTSTGRVVVAGGVGIDVLANDGHTFSALPSTGGPRRRSFATTTALSDGSVLIVGGYDERIRLHADALVVRVDP